MSQRGASVPGELHVAIARAHHCNSIYTIPNEALPRIARFQGTCTARAHIIHRHKRGTKPRFVALHATQICSAMQHACV
jgi:hypothetical protein